MVLLAVWNLTILNGNSTRDSDSEPLQNLVQGDDPDVVFVIDVSGSTDDRKFGGTIDVGDRNNDESSNDVLDAEIAGFTALNQQLIDQGLGDINLGIVTFAGSAQTLITTTPNSGDVDDALSSLSVRGGTNFANGLEGAEEVFLNFGTEPGNGNLIFLSDGENGVRSTDEVVTRLNSQGINISAFGVALDENDATSRTTRRIFNGSTKCRSRCSDF